MHRLPPALPQPGVTSRQPRAPWWGKWPAIAQSVALSASSSLAHWYVFQNDTLCFSHFMWQCWFSTHTKRGCCWEIPYFFSQFHRWDRITSPVNFKGLPLSYKVSDNLWPLVIPVPVWSLLWQTFWGIFLPQPFGPSPPAFSRGQAQGPFAMFCSLQGQKLSLASTGLWANTS